MIDSPNVMAPRRLFIAGLLAGVVMVGGSSWGEEKATKAGRLKADPNLAKVSSHLLKARDLIRQGTPPERIQRSLPLVGFRDDLPEIEIRLRSLTPAIVARVREIGMQVSEVHYRYARLVGSCSTDLLDEIAAIPEVATIHPNYGAISWTGAVTSQGDGSIRADDARADFGVEGAGVQVGILADSFHATASVGGTLMGSGCSRTLTGSLPQASGDLPPGVTVLDNCESGNSSCNILRDEGAAMGEIVHDLAPGAGILFHSALNSEADFATGITELRACGAEILADDVLWLREPMFQDGIVAQAVQAAVDDGASYFASAGNQASFGVDEVYVDSDPDGDDELVPPSGVDLHDFGADNRFGAITIPDGCGILLVLQWNQPYSGTLGAGSSNDLDLYLCSGDSLDLNSEGSLFGCDSNGALASANDGQSCGGVDPPSGDPVELLAYVNTTGSPVTAQVAVEHYCGTKDNVRFRIATFGLNCGLTDPGFAFEGPGIFDKSSIYGHAAAAGANAVGSVFYGEIDTGGDVTLPLGAIDVNPNSSAGGEIPFYFDGSGNPLPGAPVTRFKPQLVGPDGTNTTFFGQDIAFDADSFPNFSGTSAAAAHVAGAAALVVESDPNQSPAQLLNVLGSTALDIEALGVDPLAGAGLIQAYEAVQGLQTVAVAIDKQVVAVLDPGGAPDSDGAVDEAGDRITYDLVVTNTGSVILTNITVDDDLTGTVAEPCSSQLSPSQSCTVTVDYTVTIADIDTNGGGDGDIDNTATVNTDQTAPRNDSATVPVDQNFVMTFDKQIVGVTNPDDSPDVDGAIDEAGDTITYDLVVTNAGGPPLTNVTVDDDLTGTEGEPCAASLATGNSCTVIVTYTATQADIDDHGGGDGTLDNTATAASDQTEALQDSAEVPVLQAPALVFNKQVVGVTNPDSSPDSDGIIDQAGDTIGYDLVVTNTGNQTLTVVTVSDALTGTANALCAASLPLGQSCTVSVSYAATQAEIDSDGGGDGDIDNTASVDSTQTDAVEDSAAVPIFAVAALEIDKQVVDVINPDRSPDADGAIDQAGDTINYDLVVTNTGNQTLTTVRVSDALTATFDEPCAASLPPGESCTVAVSYSATQADIDGNGGGDGDIDNTASADSTQTGAVSDSATVPIIRAPALAFDKQVVGVTNPDSSPDADGAVDEAGDTIGYDLVATNTGNQTLTMVRVSDALTATVNVLCAASLPPGESCTVAATYAATQADVDGNGGGDGDIDNTASADSAQTDAMNDSATVPVIGEPGLAIAKQVVSLTNPDSSPDADGVVDEAGDTVGYDLVVTNTGNQTLTSVQVNDALTATVNVPCAASLPPGETCTVPVTYAATQADIDSNGGGDGDIDNTASADSSQTDAMEDSAEVQVIRAPALSIAKQVVRLTNPDGSPDADGVVDEAGDTIGYDLIATNTGNQTLTTVTVTDALTSTFDALCVASLPPGESCTVSVSYAAMQSDIDGNGGGDGDIDNTASADSAQTGAVNDSAAVPVVRAPALAFDKQVVGVTNPDSSPDADGVVDEAGDMIGYDLVATNTGNQTLTSVTVSDLLTSTFDALCAASLPPSESCTVSVSYSATQSDIDDNGGGDGTIDNLATASSDQTAPLSDTESVAVASCPGEQPAEVQNLLMDRESSDSALANLTWDPVEGADAYTVYRGSQLDLSGLECFVAELPLNSMQDDGATPAHIFVYLVTATNCAGESTLGPGRSTPQSCED